LKDVTVVVAVGSNLGDRRAHLEFAVARLREFLHDVRVSTFIETAPVDVPDAQPPYLNAVAVGKTSLAPEVLLSRLLAAERDRGRERPSLRAARTLDLDLILYGDLVMSTPGLDIPHPRFREREFVLRPLAAIVPEVIDPVTGLTAEQLLASLTSRTKEKRP
jgi:2-amino-4-hydroxy-6-hydroxymethyldihydropteridine diphosphokinase